MDPEEALLLLLVMRRKRRRKNKIPRRHWVHPILKTRESEGQFTLLFEQLKNDEEKFFKFFRMSNKSFEELLSWLQNDLRLRDTSLRNCIPPAERLAITLSDLAVNYVICSNSNSDIFQLAKNQLTPIDVNHLQKIDAEYKAQKLANEDLIKRGLVVDYGGYSETTIVLKDAENSKGKISDEHKNTDTSSDDYSVELNSKNLLVTSLIKQLKNHNSVTNGDSPAIRAPAPEKVSEQEEERKRSEEKAEKEELQKEVKEEDYGTEVQKKIMKIMETMTDEKLKNNLINSKIVEKIKVAFDRLYATDWELFKEYSDDERIETKLVDGYTIYRGTAVLDVSADTIMEEMYEKFEQQPKWNKSFKSCKVIAVIGKDTDVTYREVIIPGAYNRDYVIFRHKSKFGDADVVVNMSMDCYCDPVINNPNGDVRAYTGPSCSVMKPMGPNKSWQLVLLDNDLKGYINRAIPNSLIAILQQKYMSNLRTYFESLKP